jgi:hypothetical protein
MVYNLPTNSKTYIMNTSDLFSLSSALGSSYKDYWISRDLTQVYSTKRPGTPYAMTKTGTGSCRDSYWSLSSGGRFGNFTIRTDELARRVTKSPEFQAWFQAWKKTPAVAASSPTKGFIVGRVFVNNMSFASNPKVHSTEASAITECERLAKLTPGSNYTYFEMKGTCTVGGVSWK